MSLLRPAERRSLASRAVWTAIAGTTFAVAGAVVAFLVLRNPLLEAFAMASGAVPYLAAVAAFLAGGGCWWLVVERPRRPTRARGALTGTVAGTLTHPILWLLVFVYQNPSTAADPSTAGTGPLLFTYFSLLTVGWLTVGVGVAVGLALATGRRRTAERRPPDGESALFWLNATLLGALVLPGLVFGGLLGWRGALSVAAAALAATAVTAVALGRLPVVRAYFAELATVPEADSPPAATDRSFLAPYALAHAEFAAVYFLGSPLYVALAGSVAPLASVHPYGYTVGAGGLGLAVALAANFRRNRWRPSTSARRPVLEWTAFLALTVGSYTVAWLEWLSTPSLSP